MEKKEKKLCVKLLSTFCELQDLIDFLIKCRDELINDEEFTDDVFVYCHSRDNKLDAIISWEG